MRELQNNLALLLTTTTKQTSTTSKSKCAYATIQYLGYDRFDYGARGEMMAVVTTGSHLKVPSRTTDILGDPILIQNEIGVFHKGLADNIGQSQLP